EASVRYMPSGPDRVTTVIDDVPPLAVPVPPPAAAVVPPPELPPLEHADKTRPAASAVPTAQVRAPPANRRVAMSLIPFEPRRVHPRREWYALATWPMSGRFTATWDSLSWRLPDCGVR